MSIGSIVSLPAQARMGVVVGSTAIGETVDGKQRVVVQVKSQVLAAETRAKGVPEARDMRQVGPGDASSGTRTEIRKAEIVRDPIDLTDAEKQSVEELRHRDAEVRQKEQAHAGTAGAMAGPIIYRYATGPDRRQYAAGGSVSVRLSNPSVDPAKFSDTAAQLSAAANAAHNPSAADLSAARKGYWTAAAALAEQHRNTDLTAYVSGDRRVRGCVRFFQPLRPDSVHCAHCSQMHVPRAPVPQCQILQAARPCVGCWSAT